MASTAPALTSNSISAIANGETNLRPLLQVLDVKEIKASQTEKRFRLLLSDGSFVQQSVLATQLNPSVLSQQIKQGSILQLIDYVCHTIRGLRFVMVLNLEVIGFSSDVIGDPKQLLFNEDEANSKVFSQQVKSRNGMKMGNGSGNGTNMEMGSGMQTLPLRSSESVPNTNPPSTSAFSGRPVVSSMYEPAPIYSNKGPIARNQAPARILPIVALAPNLGRWAIKGRVTVKTDLRRYNNAKGDGKFFSFDLLDGEGGEIRATCFNATADRFIDKIEVGKIYMVSKGTLKPSQKIYNHLRHDYEIALDHSSIVELLSEEDESIPQQQFKFTPIAAIENAEENSMVDVLGVVVRVSPTSSISRKNGSETEKRTVQLRDASGCSLELTMWGSFCAREGNLLQEACSSGRAPVLAVKTGRVSAFSGKFIGTISSTQLLMDPDLPEAKQLRAWYDSGGHASAFQSISQEGSAGMHVEIRKTVAQIKEEGLGRSGKPDWIAIKGTISYLKTEKFCYTACSLINPNENRKCNRKVTSCSDGKWHCDFCDRTMDECDYRYLLSLQVQDHTGVTWVTAFQEAAEEIMGVSARELEFWKEDGDPRFEDAIRKVLFTERMFKLLLKEGNHNGELSVQCHALRAGKLSYSSESKVLLNTIRSLMTGDQHIQGEAGYAGVPVCSSPAGFVSRDSPSSYTEVSPGKYNGAKSNRSTGGSGSLSSPNGSCFKCGKPGHWAKDCPHQGTGKWK